MPVAGRKMMTDPVACKLRHADRLNNDWQARWSLT